MVATINIRVLWFQTISQNWLAHLHSTNANNELRVRVYYISKIEDSHLVIDYGLFNICFYS